MNGYSEHATLAWVYYHKQDQRRGCILKKLIIISHREYSSRSK